MCFVVYPKINVRDFFFDKCTLTLEVEVLTYARKISHKDPFFKTMVLLPCCKSKMKSFHITFGGGTSWIENCREN
jgi:hypothetical protein